MQNSLQKSIGQDGQTASSSVDFEVRFVYDFGITKLHLASGRARFWMFDQIHNGDLTPFYGIRWGSLESGKTLLGKDLTKGIAVTNFWVAHIYVLKNGSTIPRSVEESPAMGFTPLFIVGGIPTLGGHNPAEPDNFHPFWSPTGGEGWRIEAGYGYFTIQLSPEDVPNFRVVLYLQGIYLAFSDGSLWGKRENFGDPNVTNVVAFVSEFNRTDEGWVFNKLTAETRNFDKIYFDPNTNTLTIYVDSLPTIFYVDAILLIISIISAIVILIISEKTRHYHKQAKNRNSRPTKTQQNPI